MEHTHIIHKVVIEVSVNNRKKAYEIKDDISSFLTMDVFPKLEKHLTTVQAQIPAHTLQISRLVVDINHRESSLNTTLKNDIITSFRKELAEIIKNGSGQHLNPYLSQRRNQSLNQRYNPKHSKDQQYDQSRNQSDDQNQFGDPNQGYEQNWSDSQSLNDGQSQSQNQSHRQNQNHGQNPNQNLNYDQGLPGGQSQSRGQNQNQSQSSNQDQGQNQNQNQRQNQGGHNQNSRNRQNQHPSQNPRYGQSHNENPRYGDEHDYNSNQYYDATENPEIHFLGETEKLLRTFIHFIEEGTMPWWNTNETSAAIFESVSFRKIISEKAFVPKIVASLQKPKVRERIINQFTDAQIAQICLAVIQSKGLKIALKSAIIKQLSGSSFADRKVLWSLILHTISILASNKVANPETHTIEQIIKTIPLLKAAKNQETEEQIWNEINAIFPFIEQGVSYSTFRETNNKTPNKTVKSDKKNPDKEESQKTDRNKITPELFQTIQQETPFTDEVSNDHQVQNAGLVLIHPFIANLFKHCNLMDPKTNTLTDPETGIHLLHYIATGKTNQPESAMLFEKYLCNIPLHQSINRHVKLTRKQKTEAAKVIGAVQQNWSAMKTASVGLLQHEFFQRPGKLTVDSLTLTVERKTQDILMDKLSWGISMIRLPWQTQFTYVNW
ncbi:contractile injection system tape measure protein [Flavobacterium sp.]|uniref:contractile injection system tape measure protein n=1 Tax=Flavobacterium sp. TaxID=239 RepID=UPI0026110E82|nr:contractile injection system tape measure protein [Flavobacterium sp.]